MSQSDVESWTAEWATRRLFAKVAEQQEEVLMPLLPTSEAEPEEVLSPSSEASLLHQKSQRNQRKF